MVARNQELLEGLVQETIKKVYNTYQQYQSKVDVFYVAFSGGKDSVVALDIVQRALPHNAFMVLFGDTGMEFPDTYRVIEDVEKYCKSNEISFYRSCSNLSPIETWNKFGPPAQTMRWCCSVHKTSPQIILLRKIMNNPHFRGMAFTGVRGDESASRSEYKDVSLGEKVKGQYSCHPILEWGSAELFTYIYARDLIINEAYKKGNSRAGCLVCPLAASKNMYFKEQSYGKSETGELTTTTFNKIILDTTSKNLSSDEAVKEFMDIGGWKARRSGKELSIAKNLSIDEFEKGVLTITTYANATDWKEWIKTVGKVSFLTDGDVEVIFEGHPYKIKQTVENDRTIFTVNIGTNTKRDIYFMSALKTIFRKSAYCIGCGVCEANCPHGFISLHDGIVEIDDRLVSVMYANNEIGSLEPIHELCNIAHRNGAKFHTDAVQAVGHVKIDVKEIGVDMMSASAHKFNGPKGIGFLYVKTGTALKPFADGGAQEYGMRAGTENVAGIVAMSVALKKACSHIDDRRKHLLKLEDVLLQGLKKYNTDFIRNGSSNRVPGNISLSFKNANGEMLLHRLDLMGIMVSTGSACDSTNTQMSHVLKAIKIPEEYGFGTIRISFNHENTEEDAKYIAESIGKILTTVTKAKLKRS